MFEVNGFILRKEMHIYTVIMPGHFAGLENRELLGLDTAEHSTQSWNTLT